MEERIIDDEYGRGIRLKKTKDGYVDVTDAELEKKGEADEAETEDMGEEVTFEFPELEEDDEELATLTPEQAAELKRKRAEEAEKRKAEYDALCAEGETLLSNADFFAAEVKFEKALNLQDEADEAAAGYWRAKTHNFADPEILLDEYAETGYESLENDLGEGAVERLKAEYREVFLTRLEASKAEEAPLAEQVERAQETRRGVLKTRLKGAWTRFIVLAIPTLALLIAAIFFAVNITSRIDNLYVYLAAGFGGGFFLLFLIFGFFTNKLINTLRLSRSNERLDSTEDGEKLLKLRSYIELYEHLSA